MILLQIDISNDNWLTTGVNSSLVRVYDTKKYASTENVQSQTAAIIQSSLSRSNTGTVGR